MLRRIVKRIPGARRLAQRLGMVPERKDERDFLLAMLPRGSVGVEIGVHLGDFSQRILNVVSPEALHLIDPWEHQTSTAYENAWYGGGAKGGQEEMNERYSKVCKRFSQEVGSQRISIHRGHSVDVLAQFPDEFFDWVYIDGNHLYEHVKEDLELSFQKVRLGGLITGDDYTDGGWWSGGVKRAVDEFSRTKTIEQIAIANGQFIFRKTS